MLTNHLTAEATTICNARVSYCPEQRHCSGHRQQIYKFFLKYSTGHFISNALIMNDSFSD